MASINDFENSMSLFYSKRTGEIKCYATGIQDMSFFGKDEEDYSLIFDFAIFKLDPYVLSNIGQFKINLETKQIEIVPQVIPQYPIASN